MPSVVFCDLRGYTAFAETAEPEEVVDLLREYDGALGPRVAEFEGTLDQFSGDGIMVFFNGPVSRPHPAKRAVGMAMAMREAADKLIAAWRRVVNLVSAPALRKATDPGVRLTSPFCERAAFFCALRELLLGIVPGQNLSDDPVR